MTSNIAARAATAGELVKLRGNMQGAKLGLVIHAPVTVYTALINQAAFADGLAELTYDTGSGTLADVRVGMTVKIGSTAGGSERGVFRVRKLPTATALYINQTSTAFADNDYITIVEDYSLWQRVPTVANNTLKMDFDIEYGDYRNGGCIPRVAPISAVLHLVNGTVTFSPPDPTGSACYDGATIASYQYYAPGAATTSNMDTSAPSWTYDTAGQYAWRVDITDSLGRVTTAHRWIYVDPTSADFVLENCTGSFDAGGWEFAVRVYGDTSGINDRTLCTLYADDYYQHNAESIGKIAGYENILAVGWIDGESVVFDSEKGETSFTVHGAAFWLEKINAYPFEVQDTPNAPTSWKKITEMTVDKVLAHLLFWTTTAPLIMDCYFTGDTLRLALFAAPVGSVMSQINALALKIFARGICNNYGQMYVEIDPQIIPSAARAALPVVMDITTQDRAASLGIERNTTTKAAQIELGVTGDFDGSSSALLYSRAPGTVNKTWGDVRSFNNYNVVDQDETNRIAGCLLAVENREFEPVDVALVMNNRLIDIAPRMYCTMTIAANENPRGIEFTSRLIPRKVDFIHNRDTGALTTSASFEFEVVGVDGVTYIPPTVITDNFDGFDSGDFGGVDFPSSGLGDWFPSVVPPAVSTPCNSEIPNGYSLTWDVSEIRGDGTLVARAYFPCKIRAAGGLYTTGIQIRGVWYGDSLDVYNVYGIKDGARVITATVDRDDDFENGAEFSPLNDTEVDGFEIDIPTGLGAVIEYIPGDEIDSGHAAPTDATGTAQSVTVGAYYSIEGYAGYWKATPGGANNYRVQLKDQPLLDEDTTTLSPYTRRFYVAISATIYVRVADAEGAFANNSGPGVDWIFRSVIANGRRIELADANLQNVCAL